MNKRGLLGKLLVIVIILILWLLIFNKLSRAEISINIVNATMNISTNSILLNISNVIYIFNNTPQQTILQQNFSVFFSINQTNITIISNITCNNASVSLSCSCPSCPSLQQNINCSFPSKVDLANETKTEFFNHYINSLGSKIEESSNKVTQDVLFKLEPTKAQLESCQQTAFNASLKEQEAYRIRDKFVSDNIALTSVLENEKNEKKTLQLIFWSFIGFIIISVSVYFGVWERKGGLFG